MWPSIHSKYNIFNVKNKLEMVIEWKNSQKTKQKTKKAEMQRKQYLEDNI